MVNTIIFWIGFFSGIPLGVLACRIYKPFMYIFFGCLLLSLSHPDWSISFISRETYKSATRGFEVHLADLFAIIIAIAMLQRRQEFHLKFFLPLTIPYLLYLLVSIISWFFIPDENILFFGGLSKEQTSPFFEIKLYPWFEISKILRGMFIIWLSANFFQDVKAIKTWIITVAIFILYLTIRALIDRYVHHINRVAVYLQDPNIFNTLIGILGAFVCPFIFDSKKWYKSLFFAFLALCCFVDILLTISRSSLLGYTVALFLIMILSLYKFPSIRNITMCLVGLCLGTLFLLKASGTLLERFGTESTLSDLGGRAAVNESGMQMAREHFFGVGLGNFMAYDIKRYALEVGVYNVAHNIWFLTLGEIGYIGLFIFLIIWARFYQMLFQSLFLSNYIKEIDGYSTYSILLGILGSSIVMQFQNLYHFAYRTTCVFFTMQILTGLTIRIYLDLRKRRKEKSSKKSNIDYGKL